MLGPQNLLFMYRIYHCHLRPYINERDGLNKPAEIKKHRYKKEIK